MISITEEQKSILSCYTGGKNKIVREIQMGIEVLRATEEDPEMQELMEDLAGKLNTCTNREFFLLRGERLIDTETEESEIPDDIGGVEDVWESDKNIPAN